MSIMSILEIHEVRKGFWAFFLIVLFGRLAGQIRLFMIHFNL